MKRLNELTILIISLLAASVVVYVVHFLVFRDVYHIFFYGIMDVGFTPISVLLVTLFINRLLTERERRALLSKLDMVIGVFFTEVGTGLLKDVSGYDVRLEEYRGRLLVTIHWTDGDFRDMARGLGGYDFKIDSRRGDLVGLRAFLRDKRGFLLRLLENPNLLAHETFTELMLAVTHMAEELEYRTDLSQLPPADHAHLSGDIKRAYGLLIREWLRYMAHLKADYPYLFSLALRTNPFDPEAAVEIKE